MKNLTNLIGTGTALKDLLTSSPIFLVLIILYSIYSIFYVILYLNLESPSDLGTALGLISIFIGLISIYYALYMSRKSTKQLKELQIDYWNTRGVDYSKQKKYDDALQSYEKAIDLDPSSSKLRINKANALSSKGQYKDAIETIRTAIMLEKPTSDRYPRALNTKGEVLFRQSKYHEAIAAFEEAIKQNPQLVYPWINLGAVHYELEKYDKAIEAYDKAIKLDPKFVGAYYGKGRAHNSKKEYQEAIEALDNAIERFERTRLEKLDRFDIEMYALIWSEKGITLTNQKKNDDALDNAIHAYRTAIEFDPRYKVAWYNLGNIYSDKTEYDRAIEAYDRAIDINPRDVDVLSARGKVLHLKGEYNKALEAYDKIMEKLPSEDSAYFSALVNRGNALCGLEKFDEALKDFERAKKIDPFNTIVLDNMSLVLLALGRNEEAESVREKASRLTRLVQNSNSYIDSSDP